jgi:hypothetical protein
MRTVYEYSVLKSVCATTTKTYASSHLGPPPGKLACSSCKCFPHPLATTGVQPALDFTPVFALTCAQLKASDGSTADVVCMVGTVYGGYSAWSVLRM